MKIGDIVILKSGGPEMTINKKYLEKDGSASYQCVWLNYGSVNYKQTLEYNMLHENALELVKH